MVNSISTVLQRRQQHALGKRRLELNMQRGQSASQCHWQPLSAGLYLPSGSSLTPMLVRAGGGTCDGMSGSNIEEEGCD